MFKASMQCAYMTVDPIENETDLAIEEEKEWVENKARLQADRRWSRGSLEEPCAWQEQATTV